MCGKAGGAGFTEALRNAGYDVPKRGVIAYAHPKCLVRVLKKTVT